MNIVLLQADIEVSASDDELVSNDEFDSNEEFGPNDADENSELSETVNIKMWKPSHGSNALEGLVIFVVTWWSAKN